MVLAGLFVRVVLQVPEGKKCLEVLVELVRGTLKQDPCNRADKITA